MSGNGSHPARACVIVNARSGRSNQLLGSVLPVLFRHGWDLTVREKQHKGEATSLAREAAEAGYDPVIACGGDGTVSEVMAGLLETNAAMGVIPGGTENVWSKEIGISQRPEAATAQLILSSRARVDVGRVEVGGERHHFLLMAGMGIDAVIMEHVSRAEKNAIGPLAVVAAAGLAIPGIRQWPVRIGLDDLEWEGDISQIVAGNTRRYGGFTRITPDAYVDDGLLDCTVFTTRGVSAACRQFASLLLRQRPADASAECYRAASITVRSATKLPLQLDGSFIKQSGRGEAEYTFRTEHRALTVLLPRTYHRDLFHALPQREKNGKHAGEKKR